MNIYFACAIVGGRQDEDFYRQLVTTLLSDGHSVPTAGNAGLIGAAGLESEMPPRAVYARDIKWLESCDVLIAEVSTPSHGVGYEISYALERGKPVLCLARRGVHISKMITGNSMPGIQNADYANLDEALQVVRKFLQAYA